MNPVLVGGEWRAADEVGAFCAVNPRTSEPLNEEYPKSGWTDCDAALDAASAASEELETVPSEQIAAFLDGFADRLTDSAPDICAQAELETGLPLIPRLLDIEMPRTVGQLRAAAQAAREGSWRMPIVDKQAGLFSCYGPLGPVLVMGPNNFPLAFNAVAGGDFAAAIAAGNPVVAKAHPGHPGTSRLLAEQAHLAVADSGLPMSTVQMLYEVSKEDGLRMIADPRLGTAAFTGSRAGGLALKKAADHAGKPIYLEMSSMNPVFLLPGALKERPDDLPEEIAASVLLGTGQFCTCPNLLILIKGDSAESSLNQIKARMESQPVGVLLTEGTLTGLQESVQALCQAGAELVAGGSVVEGTGFRFQNTLLRTTGDAFLDSPGAFQREAFGPATLAVVVRDTAEAVSVARCIEGSLTASVYSAQDGTDDDAYRELAPVLRRRAGRLLNDKMPTGVAVSPAMNHGGPFPATGHPGFTAVGIPASLRRFAKLDCYDNVRPERLPDAFRR